ncbi:carboxymuconolactone decarboxylase family protein [Leifsonia flava]|uniref:Carboxymuconolactone decarboxylase family protein n=1 Tax=Orlajensenia leifsoniae TaxID=2561933 RepID=A0A4Y9QPC2_9MICO|nr:carboxymuconolactone decarboxylase family protein [Leifsonia flava]TFV94070.1 carboxymuconolactone decarboxylase family protein [Leifsonia flava]
MSIIRTVPDDEATGRLAELYADDIADQGFVAAHTRVMGLHPEAYDAWEALITAIGRPMGKRRYELVTLAAARGSHSRHCRLAHGRRTLTLALFDVDQLIRIARDYGDADLTEAEVAMMAFAEQVSVDASVMTDADSQRLRDVGFSDREILDITLAAAARNYYSRAVQALAVDVDETPGISEELKVALVAGI